MATARGRGSVVEHHLAKVRVAGSNPVVRSKRNRWSEALSEGPVGCPREAQDLPVARTWRATGAVEVIEGFGTGFPGVGKEVPVAVRGDPDGRVPEMVLDLVHVVAPVDEPCSAGVAQVMKPEGNREPGDDDGRLEMAAREVAVAEGPAL